MIKIKGFEPKKAVCVLAELSQDEEERLLAESREKAYRDWQASMEGFFSDGKIEGKIDDAVNLMFELDLDINQALKLTKLTEKYKEQVLEKFNKIKVMKND